MVSVLQSQNAVSVTKSAFKGCSVDNVVSILLLPLPETKYITFKSLILMIYGVGVFYNSFTRYPEKQSTMLLLQRMCVWILHLDVWHMIPILPNWAASEIQEFHRVLLSEGRRKFYKPSCITLWKKFAEYYFQWHARFTCIWSQVNEDLEMYCWKVNAKLTLSY